jgi:hypothetical protein
MKTITLTCEKCGKEYIKQLKEHNRKQKNGNIRNFCSISCAVSMRNNSMTKKYWMEKYEKQKKSFDIKNVSNNRGDIYSPFKPFLNSGRASIMDHKEGMNIDLPFLKEIWEKQNGICPYTGLKMELPKNTKNHSKKSLKKASLDRIDSSKGYIKGNVEFVCMAINLAKNNHTKEDMISFIKDTFSVNQVQPT